MVWTTLCAWQEKRQSMSCQRKVSRKFSRKQCHQFLCEKQQHDHSLKPVTVTIKLFREIRALACGCCVKRIWNNNDIIYNYLMDPEKHHILISYLRAARSKEAGTKDPKVFAREMARKVNGDHGKSVLKRWKTLNFRQMNSNSNQE